MGREGAPSPTPRRRGFAVLAAVSTARRPGGTMKPGFLVASVRRIAIQAARPRKRQVVSQNRVSLLRVPSCPSWLRPKPSFGIGQNDLPAINSPGAGVMPDYKKPGFNCPALRPTGTFAVSPRLLAHHIHHSGIIGPHLHADLQSPICQNLYRVRAEHLAQAVRVERLGVMHD